MVDLSSSQTAIEATDGDPTSQSCLVGGFSPPLWKMMDFVSWDDDSSQYMEKYKMFQTTNQFWMCEAIIKASTQNLCQLHNN